MTVRTLLDKRGFTLVEVFIAMVILGVGVMGFIALQTASIQARAHAQRLTTATELTSALLDELMVTDPNVLTNGNDTVSVDGVNFTRSWTVTNDDPVSRLNRIQVTTQWTEKSRTRSMVLSAVVVQ